MSDVYIKAEDLEKWILNHLPNKDLFSIDDLIGAMEDMDCEIEELKNEVHEMDNYINECCRPIPLDEFYGVSEEMFH